MRLMVIALAILFGCAPLLDEEGGSTRAETAWTRHYATTLSFAEIAPRLKSALEADDFEEQAIDDPSRRRYRHRSSHELLIRIGAGEGSLKILTRFGSGATDADAALADRAGHIVAGVLAATEKEER